VEKKTKYCKCCDKILPISEFHKDAPRSDGVCPYCKKCSYAKLKERRKTIKGKRITHGIHLKATYGITLDEYDQMVIKQKNRCAICGKPESRSIKGAVPRLGIDHNHKTGEIRELLCYSCNLALGYANDDPELLKRMIAYLEKHN